MKNCVVTVDGHGVEFSKKKSLLLMANWRCLSRFLSCPSGYKPIALVRQEMAFGLLAMAPDGKYVRVNGDTIEQLNQSAIRRLLSDRLADRNSKNLVEPVVRIKRRRTLIALSVGQTHK